MSAGMPHTPSGGGSIAPPKSPLPSVNVSTKALRSTVNATARRSSGLSKGAASRFIITLRLTFDGTSAQVASGSCFLASFKSGTCRKNGEVMSNLPATKARMPVDGFLMIVYSMPSR